MATRIFEVIKFFQEILKKTMAGTFQRRRCLKKKKKVKARMDARRTSGHDISPLAYGQWS